MNPADPRTWLAGTWLACTGLLLYAGLRRLRGPRCPGCWRRVDPAGCHCGSGEAAAEHGTGGVENYTHGFRPAGCTCGYDPPRRGSAPARFLARLPARLARYLARP